MITFPIRLLLTCKMINQMLVTLKNSVWNFHSDSKSLINISEQKWYRDLLQPINITDDFKVDVPEKILGYEPFVEVMNLVDSLNSSALNKEFNFLLSKRKNEELRNQSRMFFLSNKLKKETQSNASKDADQPDDISAWQEIGEKAQEHLRKLAELTGDSLNDDHGLGRFTIVPEPQHFKKEIAIVKASDAKKFLHMRKILDPTALSKLNDELPVTRILVHNLHPEERLDSSQPIFDETSQIIFDHMKVQILTGLTSAKFVEEKKIQ